MAKFQGNLNYTLANRNTNTTNASNCLPWVGTIPNTSCIWLSSLISKTACWCQCYCDCHRGLGVVTDLTKLTQRICGGAGLQIWVLVTPDPTFLGTGLFLFLPGQFGDVGQRMKGLVVSQESSLNGVFAFQIFASSLFRKVEGARRQPLCNSWVKVEGSLSSTFLFVQLLYL